MTQPQNITLALDGETATRQLAFLLAESLPLDVTVALIGPLGAGKTRFVQAYAEALGVPPESVTSPTFVLCQPYTGQRGGRSVAIQHLDWYRIADEEELLALGIEELFESEGVKLVEWADRFMHLLPPRRVELHFGVTGAATRTVRLEIQWDAPAGLLPSIAARMRRSVP